MRREPARPKRPSPSQGGSLLEGSPFGLSSGQAGLEQRTVLSLTLVRANGGVALGLNPLVRRHVLAHIGGIDHLMLT
jgi:hypothetical protein